MVNIVLNMVPYPSGKGKVCKTLIHRFESDWHLSTAAENSAAVLVLPTTNTILVQAEYLGNSRHSIRESHSNP